MIGENVIYKGRKWYHYSDIKGRAYLVLLQGEKPLVRNYTDYRTVTTNPKNLKPVNMDLVKIARESVNSTHIKSIGFDSASNTLEVEFYGRKKKKGEEPKPNVVWRYQPVTAYAYAQMKAADSVGKYFADNIKDHPNITATDVTKLIEEGE